MKSVILNGCRCLVVLALLGLAILVVKTVCPNSSREAAAGSIVVVPRQKIIDELQLIRQQLAAIQQDLRSGNLTFNVVMRGKAGPAAKPKPAAAENPK